MKRIVMIKHIVILMAAIALSFFSSFSSMAQAPVTTTFKVWGNCGMCKETIEKAARVEGVSSATWNTETKIMELTYQPSTTSPEKVQQKIAAAGYDTEKVTGDDKAYAKLHGCCKYERKDTVSVQVTESSIQASGLTCALCSNAINKALEALSFVASVETDLNASTFTVKFREGAPVSFDAIRNAVEDAGFSVAGLKIKADFNGVHIEKDAHIQSGSLNLHFLDVKAQELNGSQWVTLVDKNFIPQKDYRKYSRSTTMACYETGMMESCCQKGEAKQRIYHVTL